MMFYTDCSNWFERFTTAFEDWKNDLTRQLYQLKAENNLFRTGHDNEQAKRRKYEQTLDTIKEIAERRNYLDYNECLDDILQKNKRLGGLNVVR